MDDEKNKKPKTLNAKGGKKEKLSKSKHIKIVVDEDSKSLIAEPKAGTSNSAGQTEETADSNSSKITSDPVEVPEVENSRAEDETLEVKKSETVPDPEDSKPEVSDKPKTSLESENITESETVSKPVDDSLIIEIVGDDSEAAKTGSIKPNESSFSESSKEEKEDLVERKSKIVSRDSLLIDSTKQRMSKVKELPQKPATETADNESAVTTADDFTSVLSEDEGRRRDVQSPSIISQSLIDKVIEDEFDSISSENCDDEKGNLDTYFQLKDEVVTEKKRRRKKHRKRYTSSGKSVQKHRDIFIAEANRTKKVKRKTVKPKKVFESPEAEQFYKQGNLSKPMIIIQCMFIFLELLAMVITQSMTKSICVLTHELGMTTYHVLGCTNAIFFMDIILFCLAMINKQVLFKKLSYAYHSLAFLLLISVAIYLFCRLTYCGNVAQHYLLGAGIILIFASICHLLDFVMIFYQMPKKSISEIKAYFERLKRCCRKEKDIYM